MNKQELIEYCESLKGDLNKFINGINVDKIIAKIEQLDEPQAIKLKDVIVRIKQLDIGTRKVWLDEFLNKLGSDYGLLKYKAGYEQGKFEGAWVGEQLKDADKIRRELNKPVVKQFVADWYEEHKGDLEYNIWEYLYDWHNQKDDDFKKWMNSSSNKTFQTLVNMHQFGYEVEKEKRYLVKIKSTGQCLGKYYINNEILSPRFIYTGRNADAFTHKELGKAGFGEVFNSPLFEVEEVKE